MRFRVQAAEEVARGKPKEPKPYAPLGPRCPVCKGNGFSPEEFPWDRMKLGMRKCRTCDGHGVTGRPLPVVARLWYEVERLGQILDDQHLELASLRRGQPRSRVVDAVRIGDRDVWAHILGVRPDSSADEVRRAFKKKAKETHPDKGGDDLAFRIVRMAHDNLLGERT